MPIQTLTPATGLRFVALLALALGLAACDQNDEPDEPVNQTSVYRVTLTGAVGFLSGGAQNISQPGFLYLFPTIDNTNASGNGINPVDIAIVTDAQPLVGVAGALWFGTNTSTCVVVNCTIGASQVDIAHVARNGNRITVQVDGNIFGLPTARINTYNIYNVTTSIAAQIHHVLLGEMELTLSGTQISGQLLLNGNSGFGHPTPSTYYQATISGQLQQ